MTVTELAKEAGVEVSVVKEILDKKHHLMSVTDEEADMVRSIVKDKAAEAESVTDTPAPASAKRDDVLEFWSEVTSHAIVCIDDAGQQCLVTFEDHRLTAKKGGIVANAILSLHDPDIRLLEDKPFEDVAEADMFRRLLEEKVFTGQRREPSLEKGMGFLLAVFRKDEQPEVATVLTRHGISAVIELAIRKKSFKAT